MCLHLGSPANLPDQEAIDAIRPGKSPSIPHLMGFMRVVNTLDHAWDPQTIRRLESTNNIICLFRHGSIGLVLFASYRGLDDDQRRKTIVRYTRIIKKTISQRKVLKIK